MNSIKKAAIAGVALAALGAGVAQAAPGRTASVSPFSAEGSSVTRQFEAGHGVVLELTVEEAWDWAGFGLNKADGGSIQDVTTAPSFEFKADGTYAGGSPRPVPRPLEAHPECGCRALGGTATAPVHLDARRPAGPSSASAAAVPA